MGKIKNKANRSQVINNYNRETEREWRRRRGQGVLHHALTLSRIPKRAVPHQGRIQEGAEGSHQWPTTTEQQRQRQQQRQQQQQLPAYHRQQQ